MRHLWISPAIVTLFFCTNAIAAIKQGNIRTGYGFSILLETLIEYLDFSLQPVFEGMAVFPATVLIEGVGTFRDTRLNVLGMFIRQVSSGVLVVP